MQTLKLNANIDADGRLRLDVPTQLPEGNVDVVLVLNPSIPRKQIDSGGFTDLAGKLKWRGDAVAEQRRLRDEW